MDENTSLINIGEPLRRISDTVGGIMNKRHANAHDFLYPMQFACFACRKSFKQHLMASRVDKRKPKCPECGQEMWKMGRAFKALRQSDVKQWRKVELLVRNGYEFYPNRGRSPKTLRDAEVLLKKLSSKTQIE